MAGGGIPAGVRVKQQARTIDLLPTLLELMGSKTPPGIQGTSLAPAFRGKEVPTAYSYAETLFPKFNMGWAELRAMRTNRWKYVRAPKPELYDLAQDPAETTNVIASHPAEAQELEAQLKAVSAGTEKVASAPMDPRTHEAAAISRLSGRLFSAGGRTDRQRNRSQGPPRGPAAAAPRGALRRACGRSGSPCCARRSRKIQPTLRFTTISEICMRKPDGRRRP